MITDSHHWLSPRTIITDCHHWQLSLTVVSNSDHWHWSLTVDTDSYHWQSPLTVITDSCHWQSLSLEKLYLNQQFVDSIPIVSVLILMYSCFMQLWSVYWAKSWSSHSGHTRRCWGTIQDPSDTSWHLVPHWSALHSFLSSFNVYF